MAEGTLLNASLRDGFRKILREDFQKAAPSAPSEKVMRIATLTEESLYDRCHQQVTHVGGARAEGVAYEPCQLMASYTGTMSALREALAEPYGEWVHQSLAEAILNGLSPEKALTEESLQAHKHIQPRQLGAGVIYRALSKSAEFAADPVRLKETVLRIETSCFNHVIARCRESGSNIIRSWEDPLFLSSYSSRCATLGLNLDPESSVGRAFGAEALEALVAGRLHPDSMGKLSSVELCPGASRREREEIETRAQQKVREKTSQLYKCPHCGVRDATYEEVQTRSADEPADIFCSCKNCGGKFKGH